MGWPTETEIGKAARIELTEESGVFSTTDYAYNVTELLARVKAEVADYCLRPNGFDQQTVTQTFDGGRYSLYVNHPPIISVTSVTDNEYEETLSEDDEDYWVYDRFVRLEKPTSTKRIALREKTPQRYTIVYVGGYDDDGTPLPTVVKDVCAEIAVRTLLRIDEQYRVYRNVDRFQDGEIQSFFANKEKVMADQYAKLERAGMVLRAWR